MNITLNEAAAQLAAHDRILILSHQSPDGDTLGSAGALCLGLAKLGKQARFVCSDPIPEKYDYMLSAVPAPDFEPEYIVAVDSADRKLLGKRLDARCPRIDPVSYTHLDVYKRQHHLNADQSSVFHYAHRPFYFTLLHKKYYTMHKKLLQSGKMLKK